MRTFGGLVWILCGFGEWFNECDEVAGTFWKEHEVVSVHARWQRREGRSRGLEKRLATMKKGDTLEEEEEGRLSRPCICRGTALEEDASRIRTYGSVAE